MASLIEGVPRALHGNPEPSRAARGLVRRSPLFERLSAAGSGAVVLVCAPAGSGKTVLIRSWVEAAGLRERLAWVSVQRGERDAQRFWLSVIDALAGTVGAVQRVDPVPSFRGEVVLDQLLRDVEYLDEPAVLVIDDLHELRSADALTWLELFLARLPHGLQVVLATREDPRLGLHRLRLAGELTELRGPDLTFSREEARALLKAAGVNLSEDAWARLYERTEGWAAGLRLAAISLARHPDPERFVAEFSGSERTVAGYLLAEVLERQPAEVRELLLRTSLLERVSGPLADYLTGGQGAERILQELEDANAFVTSLDAGRTWFRYHHLFADLLQLELRRVSPGSISSLHRAAARWHEREGDVVEAIRHAQAARDWPLAVRLLADNDLDLTLDGRTETLQELLTAFPEEVTAADGELAITFATACLVQQELADSAAYLELAERLAESVPPERRGRFDLRVALLRLVQARWRGDLDAVLEQAPLVEMGVAQTMAERAQGDEFRAVALENLGVTELWASRFDDARRTLEQALALSRRAGRPWLEVAGLGHLAMAGQLTGMSFAAALQLSEHAVRTADAHGWGEDPMVVTGLATGASSLLWLGRVDEAERWLERAKRTLHPDGEPGTELIVHHAHGLLHLAHGRFEEALAALRAAERMQHLLTGKHAFAVGVQGRLVQTHTRMGDLAAARAALAEVGEDDRRSANMRVAEAVLRLAEGDPERAIDVLGPACEGAAPAVPRFAARIESHLVEAIAREQLCERRAVEASLERALELAEPEGILLPFLLVPVQEILARLPRHLTAHATLRQTILDVLAGSAPAPGGERPDLVEELSEAELRVVRFLPSNLRAPEIAAELCVSTNTVRTHLRHIYAKLDAHGRAEAVARARQLGLLAPSLGHR